jgi:osmotically-inducible protein OsmY
MMANERGRRGRYGDEHRGDYDAEGRGYGDRSSPVVHGAEREYGRNGGDYGQQRGESYYGGGRNTVETGRRPEDRGRSYGDWLGGGADESRDYPSQQRGDVYGGYGQQGGDYRGQGDYGAGGGYEGNAWRGDNRRGYGQGERGFWDRAGDEMSSWSGDEEAERRRRMDARMDRQHRGRGPRGYTRSDERIREDVNDRLTDDWMLDASNIEVEVSSCEVTLSGEVASRSDKRRAEDIAEDISGVTNVQNKLRVRRNESETTGATTAA